jgi:3-dehydroquinate dehydratase
MFKILLLQGANANYLGKREPAVYGSTTVDELSAMLHRYAEEKGYALDIFYTNVEGEAINRFYRAVDEGFDGRLRLYAHTSMPMQQAAEAHRQLERYFWLHSHDRSCSVIIDERSETGERKHT